MNGNATTRAALRKAFADRLRDGGFEVSDTLLQSPLPGTTPPAGGRSSIWIPTVQNLYMTRNREVARAKITVEVSTLYGLHGAGEVQEKVLEDALGRDDRLIAQLTHKDWRAPGTDPVDVIVVDKVQDGYATEPSRSWYKSVKNFLVIADLLLGG